ncbi:MAG: leucine-rich repeat protein [Promethearchaeota archaeon]
MSVIYKGRRYKPRKVTIFRGASKDVEFGITFYLDKKTLRAYPGGFYLLSLKKLKISNLNDVEGLKDIDNLRGLALRKNKISKIEGLDGLTNLHYLDLSLNNIRKIEGLDSLVNLKGLSLHGNNISKIEGLDNLKNLEVLHLSNNQISEISGLKNLKNLKTLNLTKNKISSLNGLQYLFNIENLYLSFNNITRIEYLENATKLKILVMYKNPVYLQAKTMFGGTKTFIFRFPQAFVEYCRTGVVPQWVNQRASQGTGVGKFIKGAMSLAGGLGSITDTVQNIVNEGANIQNVAKLASQTAKTYSSITGKGKNISATLGGVSNMMNNFQNIQQQGFTPENVMDLTKSGMQTIAGATGHSKEFKAISNIQEGIMSGDSSMIASGIRSMQKGIKQKPAKPDYSPVDDVAKKLKSLKELLDMDLITQEEFQKKKKELLNRL